MYPSSVIFCDLDDTLVNTTAAIEGIHGPVPDPLKHFHPATPFEFWDRPNGQAAEIFRFADPIPFAQNVLCVLADRYRLIYLTARPKWAKFITERWLQANRFPAGEIICTLQKDLYVIKYKPLAVFEDDLRFINKIKNLAPLYVHKRPWNMHLQNFTWEDLYHGRTGFKPISRR